MAAVRRRGVFVNAAPDARFIHPARRRCLCRNGFVSRHDRVADPCKFPDLATFA